MPVGLGTRGPAVVGGVLARWASPRPRPTALGPRGATHPGCPLGPPSRPPTHRVSTAGHRRSPCPRRRSGWPRTPPSCQTRAASRTCRQSPPPPCCSLRAGTVSPAPTRSWSLSDPASALALPASPCRVRPAPTPHWAWSHPTTVLMPGACPALGGLCTLPGATGHQPAKSWPRESSSWRRNGTKMRGGGGGHHHAPRGRPGLGTPSRPPWPHAPTWGAPGGALGHHGCQGSALQRADLENLPWSGVRQVTQSHTPVQVRCLKTACRPPHGLPDRPGPDSRRPQEGTPTTLGLWVQDRAAVQLLREGGETQEV